MFLSLSCSSGWAAAWVCLVNRSLLGVSRPCPLCVLSKSGKWCLTASVVSPGQDENCLFLLLLAMLVWLGILLMHGDIGLVQVVFLTHRHCALLLLGLVGLIETCWEGNLIELCQC